LCVRTGHIWWGKGRWVIAAPTPILRASRKVGNLAGLAIPRLANAFRFAPMEE
jgi:hypothetical protein